MASKHIQDPRERKIDYDLQRVDYEWVAKTEDTKELTKALAALKEDGGFPDLQKAVEKRLAEIDPAFKRRLESDNISYETRREVDSEMATFLHDIQSVDRKLQSNATGDGDIFGGQNNENKNKSNLSQQIEDFEKKKMAENERLKGNECMKSKEFQDAIKCYSKSIEYNATDAATYSNRALAHIKLKEYTRALEDAEAALRLKPDYIKAYHRRGKVYAALNKLELAIRDFQFILEKEPHNKEAIQEIKNARKKLEDKIDKVSKPASQPAQETKANKFVRVAIQEESDEEDETSTQQQAENPSSAAASASSVSPAKQPSKTMIEEVKSTEDDSWWKQSSDSLNYDDLKPSPSKAAAPSSEKSKEEKLVEQARLQAEALEKDAERQAKTMKDNQLKAEEAQRIIDQVQQQMKEKTAEAVKLPQELQKKKEEADRAAQDLDNRKKQLDKALADTKAKTAETQRAVEELKKEVPFKEVAEAAKKAVADVAQPKPEPVVAAKPQAAPTNKVEATTADAEKAAEKKKLDVLLIEIERLSSEGMVQLKKSMYEEAVAVFQRAADLIAKKKPEYSHLKKVLIEKEALVFSNIAACHKQSQSTKKEIEFCSKVIERAPYVTDTAILAKAYLGRGYAYEQLEKFAEAKEDIMRVRELQPTNQEATKALTRLNKAIVDSNKVDLCDVDVKLGKIKDQGNAKYTAKSYQEAIQKFSEGLDMYLKDVETFKRDKDVKLKVTQLYTNRSLAQHQLGNQQQALEDADYVLKHLDSQNFKALNRRAVAYKVLGNLADSIRDYQTLMKVNPAQEKEFKKEIDDLMKALVEQQRAKKEASANKPASQESKPKIQEMGQQAASKRSEPEIAETPTPEDEEQRQRQAAAAKKTKNLDAEVVNKAVEISAEKLSKKLITSVPKTAAGFESDFMSLKKELNQFYLYLRNIPINVIPPLLKNAELSSELFAATLKTLKQFGINGDNNSVLHAAELMVALAKAQGFDMTLMFMNKTERDDLVTLVTAFRAGGESGVIPKELVKQIDTIYKI